MKDYKKFSSDINKLKQRLIKNLSEAQQEIAWDTGFDVRKLAPKNTGRYADSIKVSKTKVTTNDIKTKVYTDSLVISSKRKEYNLGYLLETGTSPHLILPVNYPYLHFLINGKDIYAKRVNHPGTTARPHFKPAFEANKHRYRQKLREAVRRSFNG